MVKCLSQYLTTEILKYIVRPRYELDSFINKKKLNKCLIANPNGIEWAFALFKEFDMNDVCSNPNLVKFINRKLEKNKNIHKWDYYFGLSKNPNAKYILNYKKLIDCEELAENQSKWAVKQYFEYALHNVDKIRYPEIIWKNPYIFDFVTIDKDKGKYKDYEIKIDYQWLQTNPHPQALELLIKNKIELDDSFLLENTNQDVFKYIDFEKIRKDILNNVGAIYCINELICSNPKLYDFIKTKYDLNWINWDSLMQNPVIFNINISKTLKEIKEIEQFIYRMI